MNENKHEFIDENGNFTHSKINGTKDHFCLLIDKYKQTDHYKNGTDSQKILMEMYLFPQIIETGLIPQGMLLELCMPSTRKNFRRFDELEIGEEIKFSLPPRFIQEKNNES